MFNRKLCTGSAVLACLALFRTATGASAFQVLYHERLEITPRVDAKGQQHVSFDAFGRHFDVNLELNENIRRGVSTERSDIKPYRGTVTRQSGSWVRLTQTRDGWRGVIYDGHELYAIEPENELQAALTASAGVGSSSSSAASVSSSGLGSSAAPVMYRLADAIMPDGAGYCGTDLDESLTSNAARPTALKAFTHIAKDLSMKDTSAATTKALVVGVVADHEFTDIVGSDPEGAIVSRMDVVDGIWYSQVGIEIVLGPISVMTDANDTFSATTDPTDLLSEVATYRGNLPASDGTGLTHLMTGRTMDGNIVGIAYLGAVCNGDYSASLSQSTVSTTMGALVAAHELGHNFNSVHDGVPGVCASTPQTYLMAPTINYSNQFSSCSLGQINALVATASCLKKVAAPTSTSSDSSTGPSTSSGTASSGSTSSGSGDTVSDPTTSGTSSTSGSGSSGGGGSLDLAWLAFLGTMLVLQRTRTLRVRPTQTPPTNP
jgi:Metallo-peptidase family M12/Reprolysin family propeptide